MPSRNSTCAKRPKVSGYVPVWRCSRRRASISRSWVADRIGWRGSPWSPPTSLTGPRSTSSSGARRPSTRARRSASSSPGWATMGSRDRGSSAPREDGSSPKRSRPPSCTGCPAASTMRASPRRRPPSRRWRRSWCAASDLFHVHGDVGGEAGAQRQILGRIDPGDPHRNALHHLDEVAARVVWRKQREAGPGAAGETLQLAVKRAARERVDVDVHVLARLHVADLRLLEVRHHVRLRRDQSHHRLSRLHELSLVHGEAGDHSVVLREDLRVRELQAGQLPRRLRALDAGGGEAGGRPRRGGAGPRPRGKASPFPAPPPPAPPP